MRNLLLLICCLFLFSSSIVAQQLSAFTTVMQPGNKSYLSIKNKKAYTEQEADSVKAEIDLALILTPDAISPKFEWYNLSGKDGKVPEKLIGSSAKINALSFDREQFDKCKTPEDLQRMTGHITPRSFSHFAVISHTKNEINQHCFLVETITGKRALLWVSRGTNNDLKVEVKQQP
jgi:hypothetical protein